jgi:hypothetical protein
MKVTLLGDSIRKIGYGKKVPELLGEEFCVCQPDDNGRFSSYTLRMLFDHRALIEDSDIIHWNNGLWDTCALFEDGEPFTPIDTYVATMLRIARILLGITPNVIFATTTPVRPAGTPRNERIAEYNAALVPRLAELGVIINDLGGVIRADITKYIREDDKIHLTAEGIDAAAEAVASCIREVAKNACGCGSISKKSEEIRENGIPV